MSGFSNPIIGGGGALVYPSIHSPSFDVANPAASTPPAWAVLKNGLSYFTGVILESGSIEWTVGGTEVASMGFPVAGSLALDGLSGTDLQVFVISNTKGEIYYVLPSGDTTGVTDANNIAAAAAVLLADFGGGTVQLITGTYYIKAGIISIVGGGIYIRGAGRGATFVNVVGTAASPGIEMYSTLGYLSGWGGGLLDFTIDITSAATGASGFHIGDIYQLEFNVGVRDGSPPAGGRLGAWIDNRYQFAEGMRGMIWVERCKVQFDNSTGTSLSASATGSFDRACLEIYLDGKGAGNLVTFANGATIIDGDLSIFGNTDYGGAAYSVLTITGSNAGGASRLAQCQLNIGVECNATVGTQPTTIKFGTTGPTGNQIFRCRGLIDFSANNPFAGSNNSESFLFYGPIYGDTKLQSSEPGGLNAFKFGALATGNKITTKFYAIDEVTTTADVTGILMDGFAPDDWRRITVMNNGTGWINFAAAGTSLVISGVLCWVAPNSCQDFIWNPDLGRWFPVQLGPGPWVYVGSGGGAPAFASDWANAGGGTANLAFRQNGDEVQVDGVVTPSAGAAALIFTLPAALAPADDQYIPVINTTTGAVVFVHIAAAGTVSLGAGLINGDDYSINGSYSLSI